MRGGDRRGKNLRRRAQGSAREDVGHRRRPHPHFRRWHQAHRRGFPAALRRARGQRRRGTLQRRRPTHRDPGTSSSTPPPLESFGEIPLSPLARHALIHTPRRSCSPCCWSLGTQSLRENPGKIPFTNPRQDKIHLFPEVGARGGGTHPPRRSSGCHSERKRDTDRVVPLLP